MPASAAQNRRAMPIQKERLGALPAEQLRAISAEPIRRTDDDTTVEISLVKEPRDLESESIFLYSDRHTTQTDAQDLYRYV
jgi:hypothetical protein